MSDLLYLPPWTRDYSYDIEPSVGRTSQRGYKRQSARGHRQVMKVNVTRYLRGIEMAYFEYFIREICKDGTIKFTDSYADYNGLVTGEVRIIGGYTVATSSLRSFTVSCELEVFR